MQGLIRNWKPLIDERIDAAARGEDVDLDQYYQKSWLGSEYQGTKDNGKGHAYVGEEGKSAHIQ